MFAVPGNAGLAGKFNFHDRCRVGKCPVVKAFGQTQCLQFSVDTVGQFLQAVTNRFVIITTQRIAGDVGQLRVGKDLLAIPGGGQIGQAGGDDR